MLPVRSMKAAALNPSREEHDWFGAEQQRSLHLTLEGSLQRSLLTAVRKHRRDTMNCEKCRELRQTFEFKLGRYIEARSAAYYRVSTELAAHRNVDMERARNDLEEHEFVCVSAAKVKPY
jgi:hypothetical protein